MLKCDGERCEVIQASESPRSVKDGAGSAGGGVEAREGSGDDARDDSMGGVEGDENSLELIEGWSLRCIRLEKKPDIRLEARALSESAIFIRATTSTMYSHPFVNGCDFFGPAKMM